MSHIEQKVINVGLIGFGNIGTGVVRHFQQGLEGRFNLCLQRVAVADLTKPRAVKFSNLTDNPFDILRDPSIDIVVELMGGIDLARQITLEAIDCGKSVVNANKALLARHMGEIFDAARSKQVNFGFEASVAGGIPIVNVLNRLRGEKIDSIKGIINGTTNYILTRMEEGLDLTGALEGAQREGYAEADPTADIEGYDAQNKLAVLASLAFNSPISVDRIPCRGITGITPIDIDFAAKYGVDEGGRGYVVKLLATAQRQEDGTAEFRVEPVILSRDHPLASVRDAFNAVYIEAELAGKQMFYGRGAGEKPTTSAVIADIVHIANNLRKGITDGLPTLDSQIVYGNPADTIQRGYIRANLLHRSGSLNEISLILAAQDLSVEDSLQRRRFEEKFNGDSYIPDIITLVPTPRRNIDKAIQEMSRSHRIHGTPFFLSFAD